MKREGLIVMIVYSVFLFGIGVFIYLFTTGQPIGSTSIDCASDYMGSCN